MEPKVLVISEGSRHRELVEVEVLPNGKKTSRTFHQTKVGTSWVNNVDIKRKKYA